MLIVLCVHHGNSGFYVLAQQYAIRFMGLYGAIRNVHSITCLTGKIWIMLLLRELMLK